MSFSAAWPGEGVVQSHYYIIVRDPLPAWLPRRVRRFLGECYMCLGENGVFPDWTDDTRRAKLFTGEPSARAYIYNSAGARRLGFDNATVRRIRYR